MKKFFDYIINENLYNIRIDKVLSILNTEYSRMYFSNLIKNGNVLVNGKIISPSYKVELNDHVHVEFDIDNDSSIKPYEMKLDIIYEDDDILVINKPKGLVVHPGDGHSDDTLVNALIYNKKELSTINGMERVGIVHRIDKDTSGLLLIAKNDFAHMKIAEQLKDHSMYRKYIALVDGVIERDKGVIKGSIARDKTNRLKMTIDPLNGKEAVTHFTVLKRYEKYTLIECVLETGRTHQIRVHMSHIKHPLVGDKLYGGSCLIYDDGQLLHAFELTFKHPRTEKMMTLSCPVPDYFKKVIDNLK